MCDKTNNPLHIIQHFYQALRHSIVYINENCQAAIVFNNPDLVGTWEELHIPWQSAGDVHSII